jgi:WD40 repeat protein
MLPADNVRFDLTGHHNIIRSIDFSPNGRLVSTASDDRTARVWNIATGQLSMDLEGIAPSWTIRLFLQGDIWW